MRLIMNASMPNLDVPIGSASIEFRGDQMNVEVDVTVRPATPDNADGPGDVAQATIKSVYLRAAMALHDTTESMTVVLSRGTDVLPFMPARAVDRLAEKILHEVLGLP